MKKMIALLLALALCMALCACGGEKANSAPEDSGSSGGNVIAKPGTTAETEKPADATETEKAAGEKLEKDTPSDTPAPTETPKETAAPVGAPPEVEISDLCCFTGKLVEGGSNTSAFSFILPKVSGPQTEYIDSINQEMQELYDDYVVPALDYMEEESFLTRYCISYYYGERNGIHSLLVTCDSDWDMYEYRCYNFDDYGNKADNKAVLEAAGLKQNGFLSAAGSYLKDLTDLSEYGMEESGWKELQDKTLAEDNFNVEVPMAILPNGDLCFIAHVYTLAGAGEYDYALKLDGSGTVSEADVGVILLYRLTGTWLVDGVTEDEVDPEALLLDIFTVGDTLEMEATAYEPEYGSVLYYYGVDIYPEDPAALLRADVDAINVRVVSHCPDVFTGMYYAEPGYYTLHAADGCIAFTDYKGGDVVSGSGEDVYAYRAYRGELGMEDDVPNTDYERFDYDAAEKAGFAGVWSGYYHDENYDTHTLTLEMTNWGKMKLRDCVAGEIPTVMEGSYYIAGAADDMAPEGAVVFNLVARNGYKMPNTGYCFFYLDEDGMLLIDDETDSYSHLTEVNPDYYAVLNRIPAVRYTGEPSIRKLESGETVKVNITGDSDASPVGIGCSFVMGDYGGIQDAVISLNGEDFTLSDLDVYEADIYLMQPGMSGEAYLYIDGLSDNDYHFTTVIGFNSVTAWYVGDFYGGFAESPTDVEDLRLRFRFDILSSFSGVRRYRVGLGGMPEAVEPYYRIGDGLKLTSKRDVDCWIVDADGNLLDTSTLPAGSTATLFRTDGQKFVDLKLSDGDFRRVWINSDDWPQTIDGADIEDCFDGIRFAG